MSALEGVDHLDTDEHERDETLAREALLGFDELVGVDHAHTDDRGVNDLIL